MINSTASYTVVALPDIPLIQTGDDLVPIILNGLAAANLVLETGDVLVISSKIVSKAEGRLVALSSVQPGDKAQRLANVTDKDPRVVELVLQESEAISRSAKGVLVTEHRLGFVSANAGIDQSNIDDADAHVLLLPLDPDKSALQMRDALLAQTGQTVAIVITDTHGRPFRMGNVGVAMGVAGMQALTDLRGQKDLFGRELAITMQGYADMVASAAHLLTGEGAEGRPIVLIRGLAFLQGNGKAKDLYRPRDRDLYR